MNTRKHSLILWCSVLSVLIVSAGTIFISVFAAPTYEQQGRLVMPVSQIDHRTGDADATITVVVYSDFQCPACAAFNNQARWLEGNPRVRVVFRNFPLPQHANAVSAAFAAEAAGMQGKFWQMRDRLFDTQDVWSQLVRPQACFVQLAAGLGLDTARFQTDMQSKPVGQKVLADFNSAISSHVPSTPTVFVNGKLLAAPVSIQALKEEIDDSFKAR